MEIEEFVKRRTDAAEEFNLHEGRSDGVEIAGSLAGGLTILRDVLYKRLHEDVQRQRGMDSILTPISEEKSERLAKIEIEFYQIAVSAAAARTAIMPTASPIGIGSGWRGCGWDRRSRTSGSTKRVESYLAKTADQRRLTFSDVMGRALPESRHAPLVLFRLMPLAVEIVTALAFGDSRQAAEVRQRQSAILPAIGDCEHCRGKLLENGEQCPECGNPLWLFDWLTSID